MAVKKKLRKVLMKEFLKEFPEFENRGYWGFGSRSFTPVTYDLVSRYEDWCNDNKREVDQESVSDYLEYYKEKRVPKLKEDLENGGLYLKKK